MDMDETPTINEVTIRSIVFMHERERERETPPVSTGRRAKAYLYENAD
jgi:hypothetical protein